MVKNVLNKTYLKNILREVRRIKGRFVSFFGIILLGVMMLTGLMSVAPDMRAAGQAYFSQQNLFDLRVLSTLGLSEEDVEAIAATEGVKTVMPVKWVDCEATYKTSVSMVTRVQELPEDPLAETEENLNRLQLKEGRMPEAPGECVVQVLRFGANVQLGGTLTLMEENDAFEGTTFQIVGIVQDPMHFSVDAESSTAGNGTLDTLVYLPAGSFTTDYYTACYLSVEGADQWDNYSDEYEAAVEPVAQRLEKLGEVQSVRRREELIQDARDALEDARAELETQTADAEEQLAAGQAQLDEAEAILKSSLAELQQGEKEYSAGQAQLSAQKAALPETMEQSADQILVGQDQILEFEDQIEQIKLLVSVQQVAQPMLGYAETILNNARNALEEAEPEDVNYTELRDILDRAQNLYDTTKAQLDGYQAQLDEGKKQMYAQGLISSPDLSNEEMLTQAQASLRQMKLALLDGQLSLTTGTVTAWTAFEQAQAQLSAARSQLNAGWTEYDEGAQALELAKAEFASQKAEAEAKLADAQRQLNEAEEQVDEIAAASWYVLDRDTVTSLVTFEQNADRIESIARVFPVFFFLVAALVAITTMTRMVGENRLQMGTLKALGYSNAAIAGKYLAYGLAVSLLGCGVGMLLGFTVMPSVIWYAYSIMYQLPTFRLMFYPSLMVIALAVSVGIIGLTTLGACRASLKEKAAALLLPQAPAAGKRIWLEYIGPVWRRMPFSRKTTARNLFRYKRRFFMTVLGVAGCTALLLIGFGLQDSIMDIVNKQVTELNHSDLTITLTSEKALTQEQGLGQMLDESSAVESWGAFYTRTVSIYNADGQEGSVTAITAEDPNLLTTYFTFRQRRGGAEIPFETGSAILTEKTAEILGLTVGESFWVQAADGSRIEMTLTGITENYLFTRIFLSQELMEEIVGGELEWNTVYAVSSCPTDSDRSVLSTQILSCSYVSAASFIEDTTGTFNNTISCINYVVLLIIGCAAALAAVVLYNLISVNLGERKKELATIKVLGFYDKEVYQYIFREIRWLSLIGSAVGLALGVPMHQFIIRTVEIDQMMFIRTISPLSFLYSVVLTLVFTEIVCLAMRRHVRKISMVESMKAPE